MNVGSPWISSRLKTLPVVPRSRFCFWHVSRQLVSRQLLGRAHARLCSASSPTSCVSCITGRTLIALPSSHARNQSTVGCGRNSLRCGRHLKSKGLFLPTVGPLTQMEALARHRRVVSPGSTGRLALTFPPLLILFQVMPAADKMHPNR